jgi:hypothetical protein
MPFRNDLLATGLVDAVFSTPIAPGVLTHIAMSLFSDLVQYGELYANVYIDLLGDPTPEPYFELASGIICRYHTLSWIGTLPIEPNMQLTYRILGYGAGRTRLAWTRKTTTNIKETGIYERSIILPTP